MKNFYSLIFAVLFCSLVQAQITKGDIVLGGNVGYSEQSSSSSSFPGNNGKNEGLNINPSIGKAIKDNLVVGLNLSYSHSTYNSGVPSSYTSSSNQFAAGGFLRRYKPLGNNFYLFAQSAFNVSYSHGTADNPAANNNPSSHQDSKSFGLTFQFYPGISYAINRRWQLETGLPNLFSVGYGHSKYNATTAGQPDQNASGHSFDISSSLTGNNEFAVGAHYFIGG